SHDQRFTSELLTEVAEDKETIFDQWSTQRPSKQVFPRFRLRRGKPRLRVECAVGQKVGCFSVPDVCAGSGNDVDQPSRGSAEFRIEVTGQHLKLSNCTLVEVERYKVFRLRTIGPGLISVGPIHQSIGVEMIHTGKICRRVGVAIAKFCGSW